MPPLDFPNAPSLNQLYAGPNNVQWQWDGSKWLGTPNTLGPIIVAASPPTFVSGQLWWDSTGGNLYLGYDDGNTQQWVPASNIAGLANAATTMDVDKALNDVGRNLIHNAGFTIAQRGAGPFTTIGAYTLDRWVMSVSGDTETITQVALTDTDRGQIGDEEARYALQSVVVGSAAVAGNNSRVMQFIENIRRLGGKTVTISFYAKATAAGFKLGISTDQYFGTGGSPSTTTTQPGQAVTLTTSWARYSVTTSLPSLAGMTIGTNNDDRTPVNFWFSSGATNATRAGNIGGQSGTVQLWGIQLEIAQPGQTVPTKLEKRDPVLELQQCQRFYQTGHMQWYSYGAPGLMAISNPLAVPMRATPQIVPTFTLNNNITGQAMSAGILNATMSGNVVGLGNFALDANFTLSADL